MCLDRDDFTTSLLLTFDSQVRGITPGQELVVYNIDCQTCEGGGVIVDSLSNSFLADPSKSQLAPDQLVIL